MKISFVYDAAYPWVKGGVEVRIFELSQKLINKGHEVTVYTLKWWQGNSTIYYKGIKYVALGGKKNLYNRGRRSFIEALYFGIRALAIRTSRGEILEAQSFPYLHLFPLRLLTSIRGTRLVITWHEVWKGYWFNYLEDKIFLGIIGIIIEKISSRLTKNNIANSHSTAKLLEEMGQRHVQVIPSGVNFFEIEHIVPKEPSYDIVCVSRFIKEKKIDLLVEAVNLLIGKRGGKIRVAVIGDGPEFKRIKTLIEEFGMEDTISLYGFIREHREVLSIIKGAKVFVSPSIREGFSLAVLEAMACGVPSIVTDVKMNAGKDLISGSDVVGWICKPNAQDLCDKMMLALDGGDEIKRNCLEKAKMFDWEVISDSLTEYYIEVLKQDKSGIMVDNEDPTRV